jgi:hypothetical protein
MHTEYAIMARPGQRPQNQRMRDGRRARLISCLVIRAHRDGVFAWDERLLRIAGRAGGVDHVAVLGRAIIWAVSGVLGAGIHAAISDDPKVLSPDSLQLLNALGPNIGYPATCIGLAVMFLGAGAGSVRAHPAPEL